MLPSISDSCWAIPERNAVTWVLALWTIWDLAMCWGGCGSAVVATSPHYCRCRAASWACFSIDENILSGRFPDISPPFPPLDPKVSLLRSLRLDYAFLLVCADIQSDRVVVSQLITIDTWSQSLPLILLLIGSRSAVRGSCGWIRRWQAHWCVQRSLVGPDVVCPGSLIASVSELICIPQLEGPSVEGLHYIVNLRVNHIFTFSDGNFICGLRWCRGLFLRHRRNVQHYGDLREQNSS